MRYPRYFLYFSLLSFISWIVMTASGDQRRWIFFEKYHFLSFFLCTRFSEHLFASIFFSIFVFFCSNIIHFFILLSHFLFDDFDDLTIWFDWQLDPFYAAYLFFSILNCSVHWGWSSLSQGNEMNKMNVTSVMCCFQLYYISLTFQYCLYSMSLLHSMISWP